MPLPHMMSLLFNLWVMKSLAINKIKMSPSCFSMLTLPFLYDFELSLSLAKRPTCFLCVTHIKAPCSARFSLYIVRGCHSISIPPANSIVLSSKQHNSGYSTRRSSLPHQKYHFCYGIFIIQETIFILLLVFFIRKIPVRGMLSYILT